MKILFLDTSSFFVTVAVIDEDKILSLFQEEISDDMSSKIMPILDESFRRLPFEISDIDKIMIVNGPGSFTGVRIGVTIAKILSWSLKKDVIKLSSLEFLATSPFNSKYIIPMIDARRGYVYAGIYDDKLNNILPDKYVKYDDLKKYFKESTLVSFDPLAHTSKPKTDVLKIVRKHLLDKPVNCHNLNPNYLKKTEAEEKLESKKNDKKDN